MTKLKRLKINKFRNVRPGCELRFNEKMNLILGLNGTGKSTLLNILSSLFTSEISEIGSGEDYDLEFDVDIGGVQLSTTIAYKKSVSTKDQVLNSVTSIEINQLLTAYGHESLNAHFVFNFNNRHFAFSVADDEITIESDSVQKRTIPVSQMNIPLLIWYVFEAFKFAEKMDLKTVYLPRVFKFEEGLETLEKVTTESSWIFFKQSNGKILSTERGITPREMLEPLTDLFISNTEATTLSINETQSVSLDTFSHMTGFLHASLSIELLAKQTPDKPTVPLEYSFGNARFYFTRRDNSRITHNQLSRGQKRLLAFLIYLQAVKEIVIADELVNDLHHAWIEKCLDFVADKQSFLTSQNPLLIDHIPFESLEAVRTTFVLCCCSESESDLGNKTDRMIWRNMSEEEAILFYHAYEAGIQYVSEILRSKNLW